MPTLSERAFPTRACWDTQTGEKTAENGKIGIELGAFNAGGLLTVTDSKYVALPWKSLLEFLDMGTEYVAPRRQLIWNVRTGKEIASWGVNRQDELVGGELKNARTIKTNFVVSLSPNGKYLAEGGGGSVAVYTVQP
jgi:hypothetical protein